MTAHVELDPIDPPFAVVAQRIAWTVIDLALDPAAVLLDAVRLSHKKVLEHVDADEEYVADGEPFIHIELIQPLRYTGPNMEQPS